MFAGIVALVLILPLMGTGERLRAWFIVTGACAAGWAFPYPAAWVMVDCIAGALVLLPRPARIARRLIGGLFAMMALFEIGFIISPRLNAELLSSFGTSIGWLQWACLAAWGTYDLVSSRGGLRRAGRGVLAPRRGG